MPRPLLLALVSICLVGRALAAAHEPSYTITLFNVPGTTSTTAFAINARGQIVGSYRDDSARDHGYLFNHGTFTTIDPPGATLTSPVGINLRCQIIGNFGTSPTSTLPTRGFLLDDDPFTIIEVQGATSTTSTGINDRSQIVGYYTMGSGFPFQSHGFL